MDLLLWKEILHGLPPILFLSHLSYHENHDYGTANYHGSHRRGSGGDGEYCDASAPGVNSGYPRDSAHDPVSHDSSIKRKAF